MKKPPDHSSYMRQALALAGRGIGHVTPNPYVGCVIVKKGKVVATGAHENYGGPHAEINALVKAGKKAIGAALYVNLEPCAHEGKTPPCTEALINSGIKDVFVGTIDPNPLVSGRGVRILRSHGINVQVGLESESARHLNRRFFTWMTKRRPYIILKFATSLDGKIATKSGDSRWISSKMSREVGYQLRAQSDAILIGINTALKDNPVLSSHGQGKNPLRVILDPRLRIRENLKLIRQEPTRTLIMTASSASRIKIKRLQERGIRVVELSLRNEKFKVMDILNYLSKNTVSQLFIEGGGETAWNFLADHLVDEFFMFVAPIFIGGRTAIASVGGSGVDKISQALKLKSIESIPMGRDVMIHGFF